MQRIIDQQSSPTTMSIKFLKVIYVQNQNYNYTGVPYYSKGFTYSHNDPKNLYNLCIKITVCLLKYFKFDYRRSPLSTIFWDLENSKCKMQNSYYIEIPLVLFLLHSIEKSHQWKLHYWKTCYYTILYYTILYSTYTSFLGHYVNR